MTRHYAYLIAIAGAIGLIALALFLSLSGAKDPRPVGTIEDVLAFHERDDFNVLFILVDTLRADHLSAYGYERPTSPAIASLAADGIRFDRHVSQSSWTKCSMASLWTGLYPARSRVLRSPDALPEEATTPAEIFSDAGFHTAGIWRNGWIGPNFGFGQGFDTYTQPLSKNRNPSAGVDQPNAALIGTDDDLLKSAISFLRSNGHERWFLYLHMMDVHQYVYTPDEALFGTTYLDIYDNSIRWVDSRIEVLLSELDRRGLRDNTLIIFASDHGEAFGEHGSEGHARDIYGEVTETPLILSFPFRLDPGIVVEAQTANVDLWPTVLDFIGLSPLPDSDGRSRVADIVAAAQGVEDSSEEQAVFSELDLTWGRDNEEPEPLLAVSRGDWRMFYRANRPDRLELYDKINDPLEHNNLFGIRGDVTEELIPIARDHLEAPLPPWGEAASRIELDDMKIEQLRALGYGVQ